MKKNSEKVTADNFFDNTISAKSANRKKFTKIFAGVSLATLITCGTVLGFAPLASSGVGGMNASVGGSSNSHYGNNSATQNSQSAPLNLDPTTDETVFTTQGGIEIKTHKVTGGIDNRFQIQYFTLGSYNGQPVNWIMLASSPNVTETTSPAGALLNSMVSLGEITFQPTTDLLSNQILVISEKVFNDSYTLNVTPRNQTLKGSLPASSDDGTGWYGGTNSGANLDYYYGSYVDSVDDFSTSHNAMTDFSSTITNLLDSAGLSDYFSNFIVKNASLGNNYGFCLNATQLTKYVPTSLKIAKNFEGNVSAYWSDPVSFTSTIKTEDDQPSYYKILYFWFGTKTCDWGKYINGEGSTQSIGSTSAALTRQESNVGNTFDLFVVDNQYYFRDGLGFPKCTYSSSINSTSTTASWRPAMVVDFSKF